MKVRARVAIAAVGAAVAIGPAACSAPPVLSWQPSGDVQSGASMPPGVIPSGRGVPVGVFEPGFPGTAAPLATFYSATGIRPRLALYYSGWPEKFQAGFARAAYARGAVPLVQMQPDGINLATITAGRWDSYLRGFAAAVKAYGHPVILSFGHEMNGTWYSWGSGHSTPQAFVAAWRHVVQVFLDAGAANVKWLWTVNDTNGASPSSPPLSAWWPGTPWVDMVGIDGYYYYPSATFSSVYGPTIAEIRQFTDAPVMIAEVAVGPNPNREAQISGLFAGARADHIGAVIWFDEAQDDGIYHQDWRLEGAPAADSAFKAADMAG